MRRIETEADIAEGLAFLVRRDRRLKPVIAAAGPVPLRRLPPGFAGLARIIVGQQVSVAAAGAIWSRLALAVPDITGAAVLATGDAALRGAGLSVAKVRTLRAAAEACRGGLDLDALAGLPGEEAHRHLTAVKGIGPWTADIYLLFCLGHADVFPAGDLALRRAVAAALGRGEALAADGVAEVAARWSPWRGVAARLFWAYYRATRNRAAVPV